MYVEKIKCDTVVKTQNKLYVEIQGETITYTSKEDYDYINLVIGGIWNVEHIGLWINISGIKKLVP